MEGKERRQGKYGMFSSLQAGFSSFKQGINVKGWDGKGFHPLQQNIRKEGREELE